MSDELDDLYCCACYGCTEHEHGCGLPPEEAAKRARLHDEALEIALTRPVGRYQLSDGSWINVMDGVSPRSTVRRK